MMILHQIELSIHLGENWSEIHFGENGQKWRSSENDIFLK